MSDFSDISRADGLEPTISTSTSLLEGVRANHPEAWRRLVRIYGPLVYRWSRKAGLQGADSRDVTQEVFGAVANRIESFRKERPGDSFRGWLWGITRNKVADHFRGLKSNPQARGGSQALALFAEMPDLPIDEPQADHNTQLALKLRAIEQIRAGFEQHTWKAFWRLSVDAQPAAEVASELGMSVKAVYQAKYRVLRRVRDELPDLLDGGLQ